MKRAEFVVTAESDWGIERALNFALHHIGQLRYQGDHTIERLNATVKWQVSDFAPTVEPVSILPGKPLGPLAVEPPDIGLMDIEDAMGVVGNADLGELDSLEKAEINGLRTPGGREEVLRYIGKCREDKKKTVEAKARARAKKETRAKEEIQPKPTEVA